MNRRYEYTLAALRDKFADAARTVDRYRDQPAAIMLFRPGPDKWNAREICHHLGMFGKLYLEQMDRAISKARPVPQRAGPFRPRWHFRKMAGFFEPPGKFNLKTLQVFTPDGDMEIGPTLDELADIQANVLYILERAEAEQWNLHKIRGKNPALRFLSMNLVELLVLMEVHQRRHFRQIDRLFGQAAEHRVPDPGPGNT